MVLAAALLFSVVCLALLDSGHIKVTPSAAALLLGGWAAGLVGLTLADEHADRLTGTLALSQAVWCNVGAVLTALLVPHPVRLLLLVVPMFGVLFTALHLHREQVRLVAGLTWATYLAGAVLLVRLGVVDVRFEALQALAFTGMLLVMVMMASEVTALKVAFERRRDRLNDAMEQLAELAMRDELTGLYNRRYIMDVLARQKALADRGHLGFTLCYCDLDHFKRINDRYGHHVGDAALGDFAEVARSVVRSADYVARLGGEEFLLVLVGAGTDTAHAVAERLCERSRLLALIADEPDYRLTVSVGVASYRPGERLQDVIQRADRALYAAKSAGRDRIVIGE